MKFVDIQLFQVALIKNFGFTFNLLNRNYYSIDQDNDKIVLPNGAYIRRQVQDEVKLPGCRTIYHRQMDEIMIPFRQLQVTVPEFALFKASVFFNPGKSFEISQFVEFRFYLYQSLQQPSIAAAIFSIFGIFDCLTELAFLLRSAHFLFFKISFI
uniref:NR LBD domain-containing protein n=1 Tax=Parascaris equorum TaxID=6256 RepID=A0A914RH13_PAREQ